MKVCYLSDDTRQALGCEERDRSERQQLLQDAINHEVIEAIGRRYAVRGAKASLDGSAVELYVIDQGPVWIDCC